jgi:hypothetical protein
VIGTERPASDASLANRGLLNRAPRHLPSCWRRHLLPTAFVWLPLSGSGHAEQQLRHRHRGSFAVQAVSLLRGGAADFRIVGLEQHASESDETRRLHLRPFGLAHPERCRHVVLVTSYSTSPCSAPGTRSSYGSPDTNARVKVSPTAAMVARDAALTAMV